MPLNSQIQDRINANKSRVSTDSRVEVIRLEREIMKLQETLIDQMKINQQTLLKVNEQAEEIKEMRSEISIWKRQVDIKRFQRVEGY